jgi:hypothetical protein
VREGVEKSRAARTIRRPVVPGESGAHHRTHIEHSVLGPRLFDDLSEPDESDLRRVDDSIDRLDPEVPEVGDDRGGVGELRASKLPGAGLGTRSRSDAMISGRDFRSTS